MMMMMNTIRYDNIGETDIIYPSLLTSNIFTSAVYVLIESIYAYVFVKVDIVVEICAVLYVCNLNIDICMFITVYITYLCQV